MTIVDRAGAAWRLEWAHGRAEVQALGAMLGPVHFRLDGDRTLQVMHVAPWAGAGAAPALPGILRSLRGEWPCVPFGRTDRPSDLSPDWSALAPDPDAAWPHGFGANHAWACDDASSERLSLSIDYPADAPVARLERHLSAVPDAPAIDIDLVIHARRAVHLPVGLHPTFRLPQAPGRVQVELGAHEGIHSYPSRSAGAISRLAPDRRADALHAMAGSAGPIDLSRLPLAAASEELLQVRGVRAGAGGAPFSLHYLDEDAHVGLWWDTRRFPDLMLWVSNRGRPEYPWDGCHVALGAEPVNSVFDLGRVARPPAGHPLADRIGIALAPGQAWRTRYRIGAWTTQVRSSLSRVSIL
jgi:hypothetical protein